MKLEIAETCSVYHIVEVPDPINVGKDLWDNESYTATDLWCEQTFGPQDVWGSEPATGWKRMRNRYYFVDENKLDWFVLRWS